jgi:hypothetical protein
MGRHDTRAHNLHISKQLKFRQLLPVSAPPETQLQAPQEPKPGTNAHNQYR